MARRRRLTLAYLLGSLLLLAASLHAPTAYSAPGDPPSGSPAGAVYELPLEQGRADGAPKGGGGTGFSAGGGNANAGANGASATKQSESDSLYRTENNFGSSSQVPGLATTGAGSGGAGAPAAGGTAGGGSGANRAAIAGGTIAAQTTDTGNTSISAGIILLGGIGLLAAAVGILSRRSRGRRS